MRASSPFQASILFRRLAIAFTPAVTAGVVVVALGAAPKNGLWMFAAVCVVSLLLLRSRNPLHPMTWGRHALNIAVPALGVGLFLLFTGFDARQTGLEPVFAALVGAVIVRMSGAYLASWFDSRRPLRIAVVGWDEPAHRLSYQLQESRVDKYHVVGFISDDDSPDYAIFDGALPRLGRIEDLRSIVQEKAVDLLVLSPEASKLDTFEDVAGSCLDLPVRMIELNALHEQLFGYVPIGTINSAWFQYVMHPSRPWQLQPWGKRAFDLIIGTFIAVLALPLLAVLALMVKMSDGGPAFYRQRRIGEHGREFQITKIRTMRTDAEAEGRPTWSGADDPRVTGIGRVLRRTHLDELPQIFSVLKGEMTIVGPRPERPAFVEKLEKTVPHYSRRHLVRPGVTGWAQVRCGYVNSVLGSAWKMGHDLYYLKHRSPMFDLLILVETVRTLIIGEHNQLHVPDQELVLRKQEGTQKEPLHVLPSQDSQPAASDGNWPMEAAAETAAG